MSDRAGMSSTLFYVGERGIYILSSRSLVLQSPLDRAATKLRSFVSMQSNSGFAIVAGSNLQIKGRSALFMQKLHASSLEAARSLQGLQGCNCIAPGACSPQEGSLAKFMIPFPSKPSGNHSLVPPTATLRMR